MIRIILSYIPFEIDSTEEKGELHNVEEEIDSMKIEDLSPRRVITAKRPSKKRKQTQNSAVKKPDRKILTSLLSTGLPNSVSAENW